MATSGPAHRVQSAVEVYGYPRGHIGHMNAEETVAMNEFKVSLVEKGLYSPKSETDEYGTHDDATLLRFLRARRFIVQDAVKQFQDTEEWRNANQLDTLYRTIDLDQYDQTRRLYPQWTGRRDRRGIPVYVYEVRHLNAKTMAAYEKSSTHTMSKAKNDGKTPAKLLRLFALYENLVRFVMPMSTALQDRDYASTPITQSNNIVDISGVGLKQFWNLRAHMQDASQLATAHYPETLDRIFIIGAPAFFPTVWSWIKRWFDPITTSKIFILGQHEMAKTLREFIDPANIPKKFGGDLDFEFGAMPVLDPAYDDYITWEGSHKDFPNGPLYWHDRGDYIELEAVGSVDGVDRSEMICTIRKPAITQVLNEKQNGDVPAAIPTQKSEIRPELLSAPTEQEVLQVKDNSPVPDGNAEIASAVAGAGISSESTKEKKVVQDGEVVPVSRPEPVTFVTARESIPTHTLGKEVINEQTPDLNGLSSASLKTARPDPTDTKESEQPEHENPKEITPKASLEKHHLLVKSPSKSTTSSSATKSTKSRNSMSVLKKKILHKLQK